LPSVKVAARRAGRLGMTAYAACLVGAVMAGLVAVKPSQALAQDENVSLTNRVYRLGIGDMLRVTVYNELELSGEFEVGSTGNVNLPLIGEVPADGRTISELEDAAEEKFRDGYLKSPNVSIEVLNYRPFYILGEVNAPGSYPFVSGMSILNAVALAGGFTYRASEDSVLLKRPGSDGEISVSIDSLLLPGDVVTVEERFF
jgi:polysaccharide export outer membrane protein